MGGDEKRLLFNRRIPHALIQPAFTRRDDHALSGQPPQRHPDLPLMTTTHPVRQHVHLVPVGQQVERGLRDADVSLDADDGDLEG